MGGGQNNEEGVQDLLKVIRSTNEGNVARMKTIGTNKGKV